MSTERTSETYTISDPDAQRIYTEARRAAQWVPFFLPHLRTGMSLLDCGCGVGSITLDLAAIVAPGRVVGLDLDEGQLVIARAEAARRGLTNVTFQQGSVYALPFAEGEFDAALAHTLLIHLRDPLAALKAIRRVLKPGGVAAIADDDDGAIVYSPDDPIMHRVGDLFMTLMRHNGANLTYARHLRGWLLQAGFARSEGFAVAADYSGNLAATRHRADVLTRVLRDPAVINLVIRQRWVTQSELDEMVAYLMEWGERPDAFFAILYCAALGWTT
jgi:SAM-dependent methyltransferase